MALTKEEKAKIIKEFAKNDKDTGSTKNDKDTGSTAVQIAILTQEINTLTDHFKEHKHDYHSNRGLLKKVGQRKSLLAYLERTNIQEYREVIKKLGLRK